MDSLQCWQAASSPKYVFTCRRANSNLQELSHFELLSTMLSRGWDVQVVKSSKRRNTLKEYSASEDKVFYVRASCTTLPKYAMMAHLFVEDGQLRGPLQALQPEQLYKDILFPRQEAMRRVSRSLRRPAFTDSDMEMINALEDALFGNDVAVVAAFQ